MRLGFGGGGMMTGESASNISQTLRRLLAFLAPHRVRLLTVGLFVLISTWLRLYGPALMGQAIDKYVATSDAPGLGRLSLLLVAVYLATGVTSTVQSLFMVNIGQNFVAELRARVFNHLQMLSMAFHDRNQVGDLMSRVTNDTDAINRTLSDGLIEFISNILLLGGTFIAMFLLNWQLALAMLIVLPLMLLLTGEVTRRSRAAFRDVQRNTGRLNAVMEENIAGARIVKAFAREADTFAQFEEVNGANRKAGLKADVITAALGPMFTTMMTIAIAVTALLGGWLALQGLMSVGVLAAFVIYTMNFFRPMRGIAMLYNQVQAAIAGAERIFAVLDVTSNVQDKPGAQPLPPAAGDVVFENVSFGYAPDKPVLEHVTLEAHPGQTIALVGPTGAGKTTIISLLSRFYDVTEGAIRVDGQDIRDIQQTSLRQQLGIVLQDTFLFSGSVRENIRYGRLNATDDDVIAAATLANADPFIRLLPQGYDTQVSEKGHNFSQGQRQLIAIARAVLADPRILILDEATSSVDTRTEVHIQEAFLRLLEGRTAFVIAHRLSTIRNADEVLVVNDHRIIERGTHDELLAARGFYHDLYMGQYLRVTAGANGEKVMG
jgi:ATP-binding cassette subfamily B multidrug efflux pump